MRDEIDDLRREPERKDARNRSAVAEAEGHRKATTAPAGIPGQAGPQAEPRRGGLPRKGMLAQQVDAQLGPPTSSKERTEGTLRVQTKEYSTPEGRVTGEFVEGVLIRHTITSE